MSKAFETIEEFLKWEDLNYSTTTLGENTEAAYFGVKGYNQMGLLFMAENGADVVQFRAIQLFSDEETATIKGNKKIRLELSEYMLAKNAQYKLGKWTMDDDCDIYYTISQFWETENPLDRGLLKRAKSMLFDDVDEMVSDMKKIIKGTEEKKSSDDVSVDDLLKMLSDKGI